MTKAQRSADCANSPKNAVAEDIAIHLLTRESAALSKRLSDDATFEVFGKTRLQGHGDILKLIENGLVPTLTALHIDHALTHGKIGAVNGSFRTEDGSDRGFCVMLTFANTKAERVQQVKLYLP